MNDPASSLSPTPAHEPLLGRVVAILEQARGNVVRAVNTQMVWAYWLIGREIVQELQGGEERAAYGKQMLPDLSTQLTQRYGNGFSVPNLQNFRKFYLAYSTRVIATAPIQYPAGRELAGSESVQGFSPQLTWSHYQVLDPQREQADFCFQIHAVPAYRRATAAGNRAGAALHRGCPGRPRP